jgi:hypothetical protein
MFPPFKKKTSYKKSEVLDLIYKYYDAFKSDIIE